MKKSCLTHFILAISMLCMQQSVVFAQALQDQHTESKQSTVSNSKEDESEKAVQAAVNAAIKGPATVSLIDQATLNLPADDLFIPLRQARDFMNAIGKALINI